jgi:hypothetical protein
MPMSLQVKQPEGGGDFEPIPEGVYTARCFKVIDLGTQEVEFAGETKDLPKIMVTWEILDDEVKMGDGRPFAISKTYTASLHEKSNLYKDLVAWRGKSFSPEELLGFDISKLAGAYCQIQVVHNQSKDGSRTFANVNTIMATKERPEPVNATVIFDINNPDMDIFETFSDYLKDKVRNSAEWQTKEIQARGRNDDNIIDPKDIDIDGSVPDTVDELTKDGTAIDPKDIPF